MADSTSPISDKTAVIDVTQYRELPHHQVLIGPRYLNVNIFHWEGPQVYNYADLIAFDAHRLDCKSLSKERL